MATLLDLMVIWFSCTLPPTPLASHLYFLYQVSQRDAGINFFYCYLSQTDTWFISINPGSNAASRKDNDYGRGKCVKQKIIIMKNIYQIQCYRDYSSLN